MSGNVAWWGPFEGPEPGGLDLTIGPLRLAIVRTDSEWRLGFEYDDGVESDRVRAEPISQLPDDRAIQERYAVGGAEATLVLDPATADRAVVVRPRVPVFVPPGETLRVFVSSPVWVRVRAARNRTVLREIPAKRLTDTWFGSSTRDGELAYALRSNARTSLSELPPMRHRVLTPVTVRNRSEAMLPVDRLSLPVPYLSVFADGRRRLWTEAVAMTRTEDDELAALDIGQGAPAEAESAEQVSKPRAAADTNLLVRAFSTLLETFAEEDDA